MRVDIAVSRDPLPPASPRFKSPSSRGGLAFGLTAKRVETVKAKTSDTSRRVISLTPPENPLTLFEARCSLEFLLLPFPFAPPPKRLRWRTPEFREKLPRQFLRESYG